MKFLSFYNQKGGVGKTTLTGNIGVGLAKKGFKVLLVDADHQGNLSDWFLDESDCEFSDYLNGKITIEKTIKKIRDNLFLIPTFSLDSGLPNFSETKLLNKVKIFEKFKQDIEPINFDFVFFDLRPSVSLLERRIIAILNELIILITPEYFSTQGISSLLENLKSIEDDNLIKIKKNKIILNLLNKSYSTHKVVKEEIFQKTKFEIFEIPQDRSLADSVSEKKTVFELKIKTRSLPFLEKVVDIIGEKK